MKKFINRPEDVVEEMLQGLVVPHPGSARLRTDKRHNVIVRADAEPTRDQQVAVISGGGSGHEPAHAGYIGVGMLSAAVVGEYSPLRAAIPCFPPSRLSRQKPVRCWW